MHTLVRTTALSILVFAFIMVGSPAFAAGDRDADAILKDIESIERPKFDQSKRGDEAYMAEFFAAQAKAEQQEAALILELHQAHPDHEKVPGLLMRRWNILLHSEDTAATALAEIDAIIDQSPDSKLAGDARFLKVQNAAQKCIWGDEKNLDKAALVIEDYLAAAPKDERGARLLGMLADAYDTGSQQQIATYERIIRDYPASGSAKYAKGKIRQSTSIGKPFELSFQDAITGQTVDMNALRGKVVVIDFWATWCGPCVAEMPHMKELYEQYRAKGVEFIGVSLDQPEDKGGLEKLKKFVAEKEIPWPQYYQGKGWESEFSTGWGINGIPTLFIVDKEGNLKSTSARGKLEELIPELLADNE